MRIERSDSLIIPKIQTRKTSLGKHIFRLEVDDDQTEIRFDKFVFQFLHGEESSDNLSKSGTDQLLQKVSNELSKCVHEHFESQQYFFQMMIFYEKRAEFCPEWFQKSMFAITTRIHAVVGFFIKPMRFQYYIEKAKRDMQTLELISTELQKWGESLNESEKEILGQIVKNLSFLIRILKNDEREYQRIKDRYGVS